MWYVGQRATCHTLGPVTMRRPVRERYVPSRVDFWWPKPRRTSALREQLGLVLGTKSKIGDGSDLRTRPTQVTSVADFPICFLGRALAGPPTFTIRFRRPVGAPREPHWRPCKGDKLAYGHSLSLDHQGFRPFSPDHREAAGPVGPAVARVEVHCKLQTKTSCALMTASHQSKP